MRALWWVVEAVAVAVNVYAIIALVSGSRSREPAVIALRARRCAGTAAAFLGIAVVVIAASLIGADSAARGEGDAKATRLANGISELINGLGFAVVGSLLSLIAAVVLHGRARRARHD